MSPSVRSFWTAIRRAVGRLRTAGAVAVALAVASLLPVLLLVGWAVGDRWPARGVEPLVVVGVAVGVGLLLGVALVRRWVGRIGESAVAAAVERERGLPAGSVRGVLELSREFPAGVSPALYRRSEAQLAHRFEGLGGSDLTGDLGRAARRRGVRLLGALATLAMVAAVAGFAAPDRARAGWGPLLHPVAHLSGPTLPALVVRPGDVEVARGQPLTVDVEAPLRSRVVVSWRAVGALPGRTTSAVEGGHARVSLGPVDAPLRYWVTAPDGATTDTFTATPVDPLLVRDLALDVEYPAYLEAEGERYRGEIPALRLPEGARLRIAGRTTRPLRAAALTGPDGRRIALAAEGDAFRAEWAPGVDASGRWAWALDSGDGGAAAVPPPPLEITMVPDAAPRVRITAPGPDTLLRPDRRQVVVADAEDDHGVASAALVYARLAASGTRGSPTAVAIPVDGTRTRSLVRAVLDARELGLVPGDVVEYHVEVRDNSSAGQTARSATHRLRLPGMAELRDRGREQAEAALEDADRLAERARELERSTRDLSRTATSREQGRGRDGGASEPSLSFEEATEAAAVAEEHEALRAEAERLRDRLRELQETLEAAGVSDPELRSRLEELRELYDRLETDEMRQDLDALERGVEALDAEAVEEALRRLAQQQETLREQIDRSVDLMRRAAARQEMGTLAREAEEIAVQQRALADAMREDLGDPDHGPARADRPAGTDPRGPGTGQAEGARRDSAGARAGGEGESEGDGAGERRARQQEELEERAEKMATSLQALQRLMLQIGDGESASQAGVALEQEKAAQQSMQQAAREAREEDGDQAGAAGDQAASQMESAAKTLDAAGRQMTASGDEQAQATVRQATQEALSLAQREEALRQQMQEAQQSGADAQQRQRMQGEQAALQEGLEQLGRNLSEAERQSSAVGEQVGQSLGRAMLDMQQTMQALQEGGLPVQQAERSVQSLNRLAMSLLENDARMQQAQSSSGTQQAMQQLANLAQEQGSLNGQTGSIAPMQLSEGALERRLSALGAQQRSIARRLGDVNRALGGREDVLGQVDQLAAEADEIARELDGGRIDPEVRARQERLFHRLLDAGRSLEREEYSDERASETGRAAAVAPAELDPALLDDGLRYPVPTPDQLRGLPPAYRRLILEYFDRLNRAPAPEPEGGGR